MLALLGSLALASPSVAFAPLGSDFRVSNVGPEGNAAYGPGYSDIAYNSSANEYLLVWHGDGLATNDEYEIFGQRVSATGAEIGSDFRISNMGTDGDVNRTAQTPAVTYNPSANEYLVVWWGDGLATDDEFEIFGQRVSAAGAEVGSDFRISNVGTDTDTTRGASVPAVAYDPVSNQYLVAWRADGLATNDEFEIFGQRVSAAGAEVGSDFRISNVGTDTDTARTAERPAIAYSSQSAQFLVVWEGDGLATDDEFEIFGQRVDGSGSEVGSDFRISNVGNDGNAARDGTTPAVAFNPSANEYLVVWRGDPLAPDNEFEIFGQRVSSFGVEQGGDFKISDAGLDYSNANDPDRASVASGFDGEYLVAWSADEFTLTNDSEIFAQRVSAAGAEVGNDFRVSNSGTDGDFRNGVDATVAYGSGSNQYVVGWTGQELSSVFEQEVFGRRVGDEPVSPPGGSPAVPPAPADSEVVLELTGAKKQKALKRKSVSVQAACSVESCTLTASGSVNIPGSSKASASRRLDLRRTSGSAPASKSATLKLGLNEKLTRALRSALARGRRATATISVIARDAAGNSATKTLAITIVR